MLPVLRPAALIVLIGSLGACASEEEMGDAPVIQSWTVQADAVALGLPSVLAGTLVFADPDGDLDQAEIEIIDPDGTALMTTADIAGVDGVSEGSVGVQVSFVAQTAGVFEVSVVLLDVQGNASAPASSTFEI